METPTGVVGTLNMLSATIDWRDETARCVGVFRSQDHAAVEVEYKVHMATELLSLLARAFLKAGVPVVRGSKARVGITIPAEELVGLSVAPSPAPAAPPPRTLDPPVKEGELLERRVDRRTREWKEQERARLAGANGNGHEQSNPIPGA